MGTRVVRIQNIDMEDPRGLRRMVDPAGSAVMVAISGTVLAATILVATLSAGGGGRSLSVAQRPDPAPPPTWAAPGDMGGPATP